MTKRQLIDQILSLNESAEPDFLAQFEDQDLGEYLAHLTKARMPRGWELQDSCRRDLRRQAREGECAVLLTGPSAGRASSVVAGAALAEPHVRRKLP